MFLEGNLRGLQHIGIPVVDIEKTKLWYMNALGFELINDPKVPTQEGEIKASFLSRSNLMVELYQLVGDGLKEIKTRSHGHVDHFTIDVLNIREALEYVKSKGIELDEMTKEGPMSLNEFWSRGADSLFIVSPNGEKIELSERRDLDPNRRKENLNGLAHIGIPVKNLDRSRDFYKKFGFVEVMHAELPTGGEPVRVCMLEKDSCIIELYQPVGEDLKEIGTRKDGLIDHIALSVHDIDSALEELEAVGTKALEGKPVELPFWDRGAKYFSIRGPDGEKLEFNQKL
jgi:lactoylglutathione lyase